MNLPTKQLERSRTKMSDPPIRAVSFKTLDTADNDGKNDDKLQVQDSNSLPPTASCFDNPAFSDDENSASEKREPVGQSQTSTGHNGSKEHALENGENTFNLMAEGDLPACSPTSIKPTIYKRRWLMLMLFCLYSFSNAFQWIHLNIIADVLTRFYNQSLPSEVYQRNAAIDWLSMVYMLAYIPLIFPATWILDKKGLRMCCILGSLLNAVGAWMKCASVSPDRFGLLLFAQTICAIAQVWVLGIPPRLAAVWFGANQVSTATSIGVFGNQVGVAVGFVLPPMIVPDSVDLDAVSTNFYIMFYSTAALTTAIFFLIIIFFKDKPPLPPSRAQQLAVEVAANENYFLSLKHLFKNRGFIVLVIAYGINTGSYYAISTLLNAIVLHYFPGERVSAGRIGLTIVLTGVLGSMVAGIWLDKTKTFKGTTIAIYILSLGGTIAFTFTLGLDTIWIVYLTAGSLGFFMTGYLPVGFEFAAELTYPESEATSSGMLNAAAQVFGIIYTLGMRGMMDSISVLSSLITICAFLLAGAILTSIIKPDYRRQEAGKVTAEECMKTNSGIVVSESKNEIISINDNDSLTVTKLST